MLLFHPDWITETPYI